MEACTYHADSESCLWCCEHNMVGSGGDHTTPTAGVGGRPGDQDQRCCQGSADALASASAAALPHGWTAMDILSGIKGSR